MAEIAIKCPLGSCFEHCSSIFPSSVPRRLRRADLSSFGPAPRPAGNNLESIFPAFDRDARRAAERHCSACLKKSQKLGLVWFPATKLLGAPKAFTGGRPEARPKIRREGHSAGAESSTLHECESQGRNLWWDTRYELLRTLNIGLSRARGAECRALSATFRADVRTALPGLRAAPRRPPDRPVVETARS